MGGKLVGAGFAVTLEEHANLVARSAKNAVILRPYLGGEDVNQNPGSAFSRYVIDFSTKTLEEAREWPLLLHIAEEKVRPDRANDRRGTYRTYWWRPGESGGAMYSALSGMSKCLVAANVTKYLTFTFQPTTIFFSQTLYVFAIDTFCAFSVLQSRIHEVWARLLSSSLEDRLRYSASDCFETFPFPQPDPRRVVPALEEIGKTLYDARATYMIDENVGLTITYNRLKDPGCTETRIIEMRRLHEGMDRMVLDAYGWHDIDVPPFCSLSEADSRRLEKFEAEVLDRLFVLNAKRAEEEKLKGLASTGGSKKPKKAAGAVTKKSSKTKRSSPQLPLAKVTTETEDPDV